MKFREDENTYKDVSACPGINPVETGNYLKRLTKQNGYTVKDIQNLLHLSCPQPVYRWFKGQTLPSVDHLYVLSRLFGIHMEDLLFPAGAPPVPEIRKNETCKGAGWGAMEWIKIGRRGMGWRNISQKEAGWKCPVWRMRESRQLPAYFYTLRKGIA